MSWPLSQDYNEAIQDPATSFGDAELKTGEVVSNALGIPMPRSGNFADVYEVRCPSGSRWAVKCFTREVAGLRERYAEISKYLRQANLPFMVDFQYLEQGMRIRGQWYPILKMQWVEGFVLNEFVRDNLDKKPILNALGQIWMRMAKRLREAKLAHCDLQHGNVLFVPGSNANSLAVKLIDYDGMCVPSLAGTKSGEVGHPAFQHPERLRTGAYNQEVDRFSLLTIATGLRCLTVGGRALWDKYDTGDNLLFRQSDLQNPQESPLFQELLAIREPQTQTLVKELYRACQGPLEAVPLLTELLPEEKPTAKTTTAIAPQPVAAQGPDWDFNQEESSGSLVKKPRVSGKKPVWIWGALGGAAALLLLVVGVGLGLFLRKTPTEKQTLAVAQHSETKTPSPVKPVADSGPRKPPNEPQPVAVKDDNKPAPTMPVSAAKVGLPTNALTPSTAPQPSPTIAWNRPIDPDGDCKFQKLGAKLTIAVPGKDHDLGAERGRMNAPRLLLNAEGDFTAQVRVGGEFQPSTDSTAEGKIPVVGAGLVLMVDDKTYVRLERFVLYRGQQQESFVNWELRQNAQAVFSQPSAQVSAKEVYLRLKRQSDKLIGSLSTDGQSWTELKPIDLSLPAKVAVGIDAITTSSKPFSPSFEQFQLQRGSGEMARVEWPSLTTPEAIAVKPPRMPPTRRNRRKPVPDASEIEAARKAIRSRHKTAFESGNQGQLMNALFNDLNLPQSRNDPPRLFALWQEIRNESAKQNLRSGLSQAQSLARDFDVDSLLMKCEAFEISYRLLRPQPADFVSMGLPLLDQAIAEENYNVLTRLVKIVEPSASALRPEDSNRLPALPILTQAKRVKQEHDKLQAERKVLENNADDAKANLAVGKFHCAVRGDWGDGLPLLARGSDSVLKALAAKDLANPEDSSAEIALANEWRKYSGNPNLTKSMRLACQKRAYFWYQQAAVQLKGDKLKEVQRSLASLAKIPELQNPWWQFGIYNRFTYDPTSGYLRLQPPYGMTTREYYRGPIDITVVARSMTTDLNISNSRSCKKSVEYSVVCRSSS